MPEPATAPTVGEFPGIEGARGWLAWIVVTSHVVLLSGIVGLYPRIFLLVLPGDWAVTVFIVISGFVITHLRLKRSEPFGLYIERRALRIFPAYLVCLTIGIAVTYFCSDAMFRLPWPSTPGTMEMFRDQFAITRSPTIGYHIAAHIVLAQGILSEQILRGSAYMFLAPAWSLSLEWQFYLLAPVIVGTMKRPSGLVVLTMLTCLGSFGFSHGWFGLFWSPSFLPGAGIAFWVGIVTRLNVRHLPKLRTYPWYLLVPALALSVFVPSTLPYVIWAFLVSFFLTDRSATGVYSFARFILERPVFYEAGLRSYSVYLIHWPIVMVSVVLAAKVFGFGPIMTLLFSFAMTISGTAAASALLYRYVELPGIERGRRLSRTPRQ